MRRVFYNCDIITMNKNIVCDAMLIEGDRILAVGDRDEIMIQAEDAEKADLKKQTVLPAFIDPHSHILAMANTFLQVDLSGAENEADIRERIIGKQGIVRCFNLSNEVILDNVFLDEFDFPLIIQHNSGHSGFFNRKAQDIAGINSCFIQENEYFEAIKKLPVPDTEEITKAFKEAEKIYMSKGISVAQEGVLLKEMIPMYRELIKRNEITLDIIAYKDIETKENLTNGRNFEIGGYKIFLDGSPQAKTAWVSEPYENTNEYGMSTMTCEEVDRAAKRAVSDSMQIIAHCNGDRAIDRFINAVENNREVCRLRPVIIHGQLMRKDQITRLKELNIIPSFFLAHIYHYGDIHIKNLGKRAEHISPLKSAVRAGVYPTIHQDSPVIIPDMFESIWCAVNRVTKKGILLGSDERVSVYEALETVTVNAARQYFMEDERGSIEAGKKADFIITDKNPLKVSTDEIRKIRVRELYKEGNVVWKASE